MLVTQAQTFSPDQIQAFLYIMGALVLSNAGAIIGYLVNYMKRQRKTRQDVNLAWKEIRRIKKHINLTDEEINEPIAHNSLQK